MPLMYNVINHKNSYTEVVHDDQLLFNVGFIKIHKLNNRSLKNDVSKINLTTVFNQLIEE